MPTAASRRQLAKALGKSESAVRKWLVHPDWTFGADGPWDVAKVRAWTTRNLAPNPAAAGEGLPAAKGSLPLSEERRVKLGIAREKRWRLKFERDLSLGKYLLKEEVETGRLARIEAVKAELLNLQRLAPRLVGMNEIEIAAVLEGESIKILHRFSHDGGPMEASAPPARQVAEPPSDPRS
jgi:hypothetical protein